MKDILENWNDFLLEEEQQMLEEDWKSWLLAGIMGTTSLFGGVQPAAATPLPMQQIVLKAKQSKKDTTQAQLEAILAKHVKVLLESGEFDRLWHKITDSDEQTQQEIQKDIHNLVVRVARDKSLSSIERKKQAVYEGLEDIETSWTETGH